MKRLTDLNGTDTAEEIIATESRIDYSTRKYFTNIKVTPGSGLLIRVFVAKN
jgi:hypothetical protein